MLELNLSHNQKTVREVKDFDISQSPAFKLIVNMIKIPFILEKFMGLGLLICANSFLTLFTLVPIRIITITYLVIKSCIKERTVDWHSISYKFSPVRRDLVTVLLVLISLSFLSLPPIDISKIYHDVRGQAQIKLYVMFGVLEVADKLCSSLGQNILGILYELVGTKNHHNHLYLVLFFIASVAYLSLHAYVLLYQTVSLNVAANSYSNALLTLLFSNQFSELRSSVFKKFDREGLFQLTMADLTERFQLSLMLFMITLRNILQLSSIGHGLIPNSWQTWNKWFGALFGPSIVVLGSEIVVDWLKHCYISKFNQFKPRIYSNFIYVLALDYLDVFRSSSTKPGAHYELSDYTVLTRRIGLPLLATTVCYLRMSIGNFVTLFTVETSNLVYSFLSSALLVSVTFIILLLVRLALGISLLKITNHIQLSHEAKMASDHLELTVINESVMNELAIIETPIKTKTSATGSTSILPKIETSEDDDVLPKALFNGPELSYSPRSMTPTTPVDLNFLPGSPNTEMSVINPATREYLYDTGEDVPPTPEEKRNKDFNDKFEPTNDEGLHRVLRYEMSSKRIW